MLKSSAQTSPLPPASVATSGRPDDGDEHARLVAAARAARERERRRAPATASTARSTKPSSRVPPDRHSASPELVGGVGEGEDEEAGGGDGQPDAAARLGKAAAASQGSRIRSCATVARP